MEQETGGEGEAAIEIVGEVEGGDAGGGEPAAFAGDEAAEADGHGGGGQQGGGCEGPAAGGGEKEGEGDEGEGGGGVASLDDGEVEVVGERGGAEDEAGPGEGAVEDVGAEEGGESPALEVFDLDLGIEGDAVAGAAEAMAEGDVFDGGAAVALVEAAEAGEDVAADGAAAGPEGAGVAAGALVHEVVEEVFVLADEAGGFGFVVVGADEGGEAGVVVEAGLDAAQGAGVEADVGVDEDEEIGFGEGGAAVAGGGGAHAAGSVDDGGAGAAGDFGGVVGGAVVDDDALGGLEAGVSEGGEAARQRARVVKDRDNDGDRHEPLRMCESRTAPEARLPSVSGLGRGECKEARGVC